ncbi:MAG: hypothetical protein ACE5EO_06715 [Candidatus Krumholzibacteriia bacterium]
MKRAMRAITALAVIGLLVAPGMLLADQIAYPVEKTVLPGVTTLHYAGKTLSFTSSVAVQVKFSMPASGVVEMRFRRHPNWGAWPPPPGAAPTTQELSIFWDDLGTGIFGGDAPSPDWGDIVLTEGGWTEK